MKKRTPRLTLRRETLQTLSGPDLKRAAGALEAIENTGLSQNDTCLCAPTRIGCETG
jgi:hypothetical protein